MTEPTAADYRRALDHVESAYPRDVFPWPPANGAEPTPDAMAAEAARRTVGNVRIIAVRYAEERTADD